MEPERYNTPELPKPELHELIKKYNLLAGQNAKFEKISIKTSSAVAVGSISGGLLKDDVTVGESIKFEDNEAVISNVKEIWEENDGLFIETETSVYRLVRERSPAEGEKFDFSDIDSVVTARGSVYKYLPDGMTQRYKLAEKRLSDPKSVLVYIPDYNWIRNNVPKKTLELLGDSESSYEAIMLDYVHDTDLLVQIVNQAGKFMLTNQDIINDGGPIYIAFGSDKKVDFYIPVSHLPKIGYSTYDKHVNKDGSWRRHMGNKVTKILLKK